MYSDETYLLELIRDAGLISDQEIGEVQESLPPNRTPVEFLVANGRLSEDQVGQIAAQNASMDYYDLSQVTLPPEIFEAFPADVAKRFQAVPIGDDGVYLTVAITDPLNFETLDTLPHMIEREVTLAAAAPSEIAKLVQQYYGEVTAGGLSGDNAGLSTGDVDKSDAPVIKLVNSILNEAFSMKVSDIHIEPMETSLRVRYRLDGKLIEVANHPKKLLPAVIARLKVMSGSMSIAEKRLPQDGRIQVKMGEQEIDLRVSSVPSNHGESIVMRILDKSALVLGLPQLGFFSDDEETFDELIKLPDGIILVTGPTGSGKTTTLYACLNHINKPDKKIITVEDPVEYELGGINQVMVKADIGMTFSAALRSMLRQAPNIIMLGEIRDEETANIAINASLTGHLVFSTLHTNDAPSAVARLADIGVKRFLIASAVRAVMAQRLSRLLCKSCKQPVELTSDEIRELKLDPSRMSGAEILGPNGCERCRRTGYKGRIGLFEIFKMDDQARHMVNENLSSPQLRKRARELGMRTLREDGVRKILAGLTSAEEVLRSTTADSD